MKTKSNKIRLSAMILSLLLFLTACSDDNGITDIEIPGSLMEYINSGILLDGIEKTDNHYVLSFEDETKSINLPVESVAEFSMDRKNWESTIRFVNGNSLTIPTLGDNLDGVIRKVTLDPSGYCPLAAELQLSFHVPGKVKVIVEGKHGNQGDIEHLFPEFRANQVINVLGLYPDYTNKVTLVFTDVNGKERLRTVQEVKTESLDNFYLLKISIAKAVPEKMGKGLTLISYLGANEFDTHCPFMIDADGEIRWILGLREHAEIGNIQTHTGLQRMKNGNLLCGDIKTGRIIEMDMLANVKNIWNINSKGYDFHHEVIEIPNGNFLVLASGHNSKRKSGENTISDIIIELNRESGDIINKWDLKECLDEDRKTFIDTSDWEPKDWAHNNAVIYSEKDDCIIVSTRFQGIIKLNRKNEVQWILAPHKGWETKGLKGSLLQPLDAAGGAITDKKVTGGETRTADFEWNWGGHSPVLLPNGNILMFDNGYYRHYQTDYVANFFNPELYSRAVEFSIDEKKRTVQQMWQYGEERKRECWAIAVSSVQYLPEKDHVLFCPGIGAICGPNLLVDVGGKVIEVDRKTNEVVYEANLTTPAYLAFHRATRMNLYP